MTYSIDLRQRVVSYVASGGKKTKAAKVFSVSLWCVHDWCSRQSLAPKASGRRQRKLNWEALNCHIEKYPDALLRERAAYFGVHPSAIWYACRPMKYHYKKNL